VADQSIFTSETPVGHDFYEASAITLSTAFYSKVDTVIDAGRWWSALTYRIGTYDLVLFEATAEDVPPGNGEGIVIGSVRASDSVHNFPDDQWTQWFEFPAPIRIRGHQTYKIGLRTSAGAYTAAGSFFDGHSIDIGDFVAPETGLFRTDAVQSGGGAIANGCYTPDITNYPDQTFNATAYFVDARIPDLGGDLTLVGWQKVTATGGTGTLSLNVMPDADDVVVVKSQTWDYTVTMSLADDATDRLTFTRQINGNGSGFYPWVGIDTAVCSARPTTQITITSTPSASCRHTMVVEVWRNATIGAATVASKGGTDLSTSLSATAGGQISWIGSDLQSLDPANSALVSGSVLDGLDDGHVGTNGVSYFGHHPVASSGSTTFGVASNTAGAFSGKIAGIEILQATGGGTVQVTGTLGTLWNVRQAATGALSAPWNVRRSVSQALSMPWALRTAVTGVLSAPWAQRVSVSSSLSAQWSLRTLVSGTLTTPWALRGQISATLGIPWIVRRRVTSTLQTLWVVEGAPLPTERVPSVGVANLTERVTAYGPEQITAYL
jgi:hypothetical protein